MKKLFSILFLIGFVFAFSMQSNAQYGSSASPLPIKVNFLHTIYGAATDTIGAVPTKYYYFNISPNGAYVQAYATATNVSGTSSVLTTWQESFDNITWITRDTVTVNTSTLKKKGTAYETYAPYHRVMSKGTGTQVTKMKYFISVKFK